MKTTRILAEIDDETTTSGTESYYISDSATGLPDTLLSDYELSDTERDLGSVRSPLLTDHKTAAAAAGICSNSFLSLSTMIYHTA